MAHKLLCFAALISMAALAAGATSEEDTGALLLPGSTGSNQCVYTLYVETGSIWKAGTDAAIGVELYTAAGNGILIRNLQAWGGLMAAGHDYFDRSNVDIFSGRGACLGAPRLPHKARLQRAPASTTGGSASPSRSPSPVPTPGATGRRSTSSSGSPPTRRRTSSTPSGASAARSARPPPPPRRRAELSTEHVL
ncbi:hypothetical protein OsJ_15026 [Oryza sativa Japonica Group]|uniref:Uncharacterized protein n=1 Tax=Oryza sativa subsp. japonica TaxID=39947 RepID=A3AUF8_ORYSJ|nr:hypothetical protein OsJ_15026 [Oryza sativa Japonica Group]